MKKIVLSLLIIVCLLMITGCKKSSEKIIRILSDEKSYVTTFKGSDNTFIQENPKYNQIHSEVLSLFISFDYIESTKEAYDYAKTHNFLGYEYSKGSVKDYTWNNYSGYTYNVNDNEVYFRILLVDDKDNSIVLSAYVGNKHTKDISVAKAFESKEVQDFLNTIEFKND